MIDYGSVKQRIDEFDQRNGGNPILIGEWYWYANGATREYDRLGALVEPPKDDYERCSNIVQYHQGLLNRAVEEFDTHKERLQMSACPDGNGIEHLKKLQRIVSERNAALEKAKKQRDNTERGKQLAASKRIDAEERQRLQEFRGHLRSIQI